MLAEAAGERMPAGDAWLFELKYDGFRALAGKVGSDVALWSRNRKNLLERFPLEEAIRGLPADEVVVDGEIVSLDDHGVPRFERVQQGSREAILVVFDVLYLDREDLRNRPLSERRARLEKLLAGAGPRIAIAEIVTGTAEQALDLARARGFEGVMAKRRDSRYQNRRSRSWLKIKALNEQELVVVGFTPSRRGSEEIGALLVAYRVGSEWRFAGRVGSGFTTAQRRELAQGLREIRVPTAPLAVQSAPPEAVWVEPRIVAEVRFGEWTPDGLLRHPVFLGLRIDVDPRDVAREPAATTKRQAAVRVRLTTPERVLYPRDGLRKRDLAAYYHAMREPLLAALGGRPTGLEHWNDGVDGSSWFQQDIGRDAQPWMTVAETPLHSDRDRTVRHLVVDREETLRWLAQRCVLAVHVWASRVGSLDSPDWIVFDLDPAKGQGIRSAVEAAQVFRGLFEKLELPSVPKTSGKRGIHIVVPLEPGQGWGDAASFAEKVSRAVAKSVDGITVERSIGKRGGRLYADTLQNAYGKMIVAPYSPRGIDGAPVSTPLDWSEVESRLDPLKFTIRSLPGRIEKVGDLWDAAFQRRAWIPAVH